MTHRYFLRVADSDTPRTLVRITDPKPADIEYLLDNGCVEIDASAYSTLLPKSARRIQ